VVLEGMRVDLPIPFTLSTRAGVSFVTCTPLNSDHGMLHAFSTRVGGESAEPFTALNLGFGSGDERARVQRNRDRFAQVVGFSIEKLVTLRQVHGNRIVMLQKGDDPTAVHGMPADALITNRPEMPIAVITADCFPVVLAAPSVPAVAIIHSGRRGTAARIVPLAIERLCDQYHIQPSAVSVAIGPGIGGCCYEVDDSSATPFLLQFHEPDGVFHLSRPGHLYLDLQRAILCQVEMAGVPAEQIWAANLCTACHPGWFYSYRREGARSGRMLNVAMLASQ
jgi:purine-nucleoside/S-methyl-5'-thioadenosine phosphorylase / adenosine deaminase